MKQSTWRKYLCAGFLTLSVFSTIIAGLPPMYTTYKGIVVDSSTNTPIAGAKVFSSTFTDLATTDDNGAFTFNLPNVGAAASIWYISVFARGYGLSNWPLALNALMADSIVKLSHYEYATLQRGVRARFWTTAHRCQLPAVMWNSAGIIRSGSPATVHWVPQRHV